jgi:hypothetical protein
MLQQHPEWDADHAGPGAHVYVNIELGPGVLVPAGVVTVTGTAPDPAGDVTVIWVADTTVTAVPGELPNSTEVAPVNPVPVMVTTVPPAAGPVAGLSETTVGAGVTGGTTATLPRSTDTF